MDIPGRESKEKCTVLMMGDIEKEETNIRVRAGAQLCPRDVGSVNFHLHGPFGLALCVGHNRTKSIDSEGRRKGEKYAAYFPSRIALRTQRLARRTVTNAAAPKNDNRPRVSLMNSPNGYVYTRLYRLYAI